MNATSAQAAYQPPHYQPDLLQTERRPVESIKDGMLYRNHGTWEERNFHGYRQTREPGGQWRFYVPWFSSSDNGKCSVQLFPDGHEDGIPINEAGSIKILGKWYKYDKWDH